MTSVLTTRTSSRQDFFVALARGLVYLGMLFLPMLSVELTSTLTVSDGMFALAAVALALSVRGTRAQKRPGWYAGATLMMIGAITATGAAVSASGSLRVVINAVYLLFVWQWVIRGVLTTTEWIVKAMSAFVLGSTVSSVVAILQTKLHIFGGVYAGGRALGLTRQPNLMAITDATAIVFVLGLILHFGLRRRKWWGGCFFLMAVALILTASVEGIVCALVGCLLLLLLRGVRISRILAMVVVVLAVYNVGTVLQGHNSNLNPFSRLHQTTTTGSGNDTLSVRQATWDAAWGKIEGSPIWGHGLDPQTADLYYDPYVATYYPPHNVFLVWWYEGGIFFLVGALVAMAAAVLNVVGRRKRGPLSDTVLAAVAVVLVAGMVGPALIDRWFWIPFALAMCFTPRMTPASSNGAGALDPAEPALGPGPAVTAPAGGVS